jgi:hypothetical protein
MILEAVLRVSFRFFDNHLYKLCEYIFLKGKKIMNNYRNAILLIEALAVGFMQKYAAQGRPEFFFVINIQVN